MGEVRFAPELDLIKSLTVDVRRKNSLSSVLYQIVSGCDDLKVLKRSANKIQNKIMTIFS